MALCAVNKSVQYQIAIREERRGNKEREETESRRKRQEGNKVGEAGEEKGKVRGRR